MTIQRISRVTSTPCLGVFIDEHLTCSVHNANDDQLSHMSDNSRGFILHLKIAIFQLIGYQAKYKIQCVGLGRGRTVEVGNWKCGFVVLS